MSYSSKLKDEILDKKNIDKNDIMAELFGLFLSKNCIKNSGIEFSTENLKLAQRVYNNILKVTELVPQLRYITAKRFSKPRVYTISITNIIDIEENYGAFLKELFSFKKYSDNKNVSGILRGYFLNSGYIKDPSKGYTLDFFIDTEDASTFLYMLLKHINKKVFQTEKKNKNIVYIRNSEDILDIIHMIGGLQVFFEYEDVTVQKELNNKINRNMNYELANETKKMSASIKQIDMIEYIDEKIGLDNLTKALSELSKLRLMYDEDSFQELADKLKISKSGIRNRFRRLEEIYLELKG
ncbi:DNA-binding protein WhiA [Streptobacillus ratti]|uniref:DNA-binding protein WhiA n=1 Tax=Streptobacillus ratti TaxID=1720557 RepID=UPI0009333CC2|nr:DNA-binding protein WhiA [Streptobacillus ratti]